MKKQSYLFLLFTFLLLQVGCKEENNKTEEAPVALSVKPTQLSFSAQKGHKLLTITAQDGNWEPTTNAEWCIMKKVGDDKLDVTVTENKQRQMREDDITISWKTESVKVHVKQLGYESSIVADSKPIRISQEGGEFKVEYVANIPVEVKCPTWMHIKPADNGQGNGPEGGANTRAAINAVQQSPVYIAEPNMSDLRADTIFLREITSDPAKKPLESFILVSQEGLPAYTNNVQDGEIKSDIKLKVAYGRADNTQPKAGIELSFDGNTSTGYHSRWDNSPANYFPIHLEYSFNEPDDVDYIIYVPRTDGSSNGIFKKVTLEYSKNGQNFEKIATYNMPNSSSPYKFDLHKVKEKPEMRGVKAKSFRFVVEEGYGDGKGFASCSEMEFYKKNPDQFDYNLLFKDESCSELRDGITEADIKKYENVPVYGKVAFALFHNHYDGKEFRIADYKSYPRPEYQSGPCKTTPYSVLDNPTGISVKRDEILVVFVGDTHGKNISLRVQNLDKPAGDGFGGNYYNLQEGVNQLKMKEKGLVYVMYLTEKPDPTATPIRIHFAAGGTVNGYFDISKHKREDWKKYINAAKDKYFDLLGEFSHCIFETETFKNVTGNGYDYAKVVDKIVDNERTLLGFKRYGIKTYNRMCLTVMYHSYMYATTHHTAYNVGTMSAIANEKRLSTNAIWGPAHEMGHIHQTRPGVKWLGTTECTVNIMAEYMQTTIFKQPSRLQNEDMGKVFVNRYAKAWNCIMVPGASHAEFNNYFEYLKGNDKAKDGDVFCKLVPFWQLELYFGKVLDRTPLQRNDLGGFYPEVYEFVRNAANQPTPGTQQSEFPYVCSKVSGYDLTEFFERWGFFTPIDVQIDDYGKGQLTVTPQRANDVKERIKALGLPKMPYPIEYINDANYQYFKNKANIIPGRFTLEGRTLKFNNWQNVIVFEVKDAKGKLVYIGDGKNGKNAKSNDAKFELPFDLTAGHKVYAVQYDGKRIEVKR